MRLQEVIDAETGIAVASPHPKTETKRKISGVAERSEVPEEGLWKQWESYEPRIDFREPSLGTEDLATEVVDVKDVPYVVLEREIGPRFSRRTSTLAQWEGPWLRRRRFRN